MSAVELLAQVNALPKGERRKFMQSVLMLDEEPPTIVSKTVKWPDVEARAKRIFGDRVLPNLILLEREQSRR